jgi:NTE family protein
MRWHRTLARTGIAVGWLWLCPIVGVLAQTPPATPQVTLVLAGGGAKGFAHLAVLRRLERDHVPISKIIGTSIGAVIGSLYASGMSTEDIETVIRTTDPSRIALDQLDRNDLPNRTRAYDRRYPVDLELGIKNGQLTFARGVSDGQQLLALLQELLPQYLDNTDFDHLKIPFLAVATRYQDGELVALRRGNLAMAVRASMAAPGVFAPIEIEGVTYVDGGLVANLPIEVALQEGAQIIVASYLGDTDAPESPGGENALSVTNRMLQILIRQNERRNIARLRPQDILVQPDLKGFSFGSFSEQAEITDRAEQAVQAQDAAFQRLAALAAPPRQDTELVDQPAEPFTVDKVQVHGNQNVSAASIEHALQALVGQPFQPTTVKLKLAELYATGDFERLSYQLIPGADGQHILQLDVNEKTYGPNYLKTNLGFYSERDGSNLFSVGVGLRRPWLTASGLELQVDMRAGSQNELSASLFQPLADRWALNPYASYISSALPLYRPDVQQAQTMAQATLTKQEAGILLSYDITPHASTNVGLFSNRTDVGIDSPRDVSFPVAGGPPASYHLDDGQWQFTGLKVQLTADLLDSASFPTQGYYFAMDAAQGLSGTNQYASYRTSALWATSLGPHVLNLGANLGTDHIFECEGCSHSATLAPFYLGGFQSMGAYHLGQLNGDRLAHLQATYMYRLSTGGVLHQPTYVGLVAEVGDAWLHSNDMELKRSTTMFVAVDSRIGDIYLGAASGSDGNRNLFLQLGRRFSLW